MWMGAEQALRAYVEALMAEIDRLATGLAGEAGAHGPAELRGPGRTGAPRPDRGETRARLAARMLQLGAPLLAARVAGGTGPERRDATRNGARQLAGSWQGQGQGRGRGRGRGRDENTTAQPVTSDLHDGDGATMESRPVPPNLRALRHLADVAEDHGWLDAGEAIMLQKLTFRIAFYLRRRPDSRRVPGPGHSPGGRLDP